MSIDRTTDLGELKVFEGPEADAAMVRLALEREGIRTQIQSANAGRVRLRGTVYVVDQSHVEQARTIVARHLRGESVSPREAASPWRCPSCKELVEGQFQQCWKCGHAKPG
jgi:hypothetical protein